MKNFQTKIRMKTSQKSFCWRYRMKNKPAHDMSRFEGVFFTQFWLLFQPLPPRTPELSKEGKVMSSTQSTNPPPRSSFPWTT
jgi:hypothetical protein